MTSDAEQSGAEMLASKLAEALARALQPSTMPIDVRLWDTEAVASWLGLSVDTVSRQVITRAGFPTPIKPTNSAQSQKRWFAGEVIDWARRNRGSNLPRGRGRPRTRA